MNYPQVYNAEIQKRITLKPDGTEKAPTQGISPDDLIGLAERKSNHFQWLSLPETVAFLSHLELQCKTLIENASDASLSGSSPALVRDLMFKYNTITEILNYARNINDIR